MQSFEFMANRVDQATEALLGHQPAANQIQEWTRQYRQLCESILDSRGVELPSIAVVGAKGQGKTWIARQFLNDSRIADLLPSGVLSSEATTKLFWVGPSVPEGLDHRREVYVPCQSNSMVILRQPYMLLDTPGITDDDVQAAQIAKEAMSLSPIKLLVVRRDQLRAAIIGSLATFTEGAICIPIVNCIPPNELTRNETSNEDRCSSSLSDDLATYEAAIRGLAPETRFLPAILLEDWEATGNEHAASKRFRDQIVQRLQGESIESIAATKMNRMSAAWQRLRSRIEQLLETQIPVLASSVRKLQQEADDLPTQAIEAVLGAPNVLQAAIRARMRAHILTETGLIWFPYRTVLSVLSLTSGAWDRVVLSFAGSVPSIFGTFLAWAKTLQQTKEANREMQEGIRDRLNRQLEDRLEPTQSAFYRSVGRIRGDMTSTSERASKVNVRLTGVEELQTRARTTFEWCVDRVQAPRWVLQCLGLVGCCLFWGLLAGPVIAVYSHYLSASADSLMGNSATIKLESFHFPPGLLLTSALLSLFPLLVYCMIVFSWLQRASKIKRIAADTIAAEHKMLEDLKKTGVIRLYYDDPLLEQAEFLVNLRQETR